MSTSAVGEGSRQSDGTLSAHRLGRHIHRNMEWEETRRRQQRARLLGRRRPDAARALGRLAESPYAAEAAIGLVAELDRARRRVRSAPEVCRELGHHVCFPHVLGQSTIDGSKRREGEAMVLTRECRRRVDAELQGAVEAIGEADLSK